MSKPRKDRSTPSGSTPVDAESAADGVTGTGDATSSAASWEPRSTVKTPADEPAATTSATSSATAAKAGSVAKTGSVPKKATGKGSAKKKSTSSRADAAEELARRTTAQKVRVSGGDNPTWWVPLMVGLMVLGLIWLVVTYLAQGSYPAPKLGVVWNLGIGFVLVMLGFLMTTRWK